MWSQDESGRVHTPLEPVVLGAALALIPVFILQLDASGAWQTAAFVANWIIWVIFAIELAAILVVATRRKAALRAHWLDVAIVVLTIPLIGQFASSLRFFRLLRVALSCTPESLTRGDVRCVGPEGLASAFGQTVCGLRANRPWAGGSTTRRST
jgi:hypothetical protein